jgi:hypothetical protein
VSEVFEKIMNQESYPELLYKAFDLDIQGDEVTYIKDSGGDYGTYPIKNLQKFLRSGRVTPSCERGTDKLLRDLFRYGKYDKLSGRCIVRPDGLWKDLTKKVFSLYDSKCIITGYTGEEIKYLYTKRGLYTGKELYWRLQVCHTDRCVLSKWTDQYGVTHESPYFDLEPTHYDLKCRLGNMCDDRPFIDASRIEPIILVVGGSLEVFGP